MKQTFIYIFMFLSIISQTSCEDQLNALPTQSKVEGNVIVDQASAEIALNGVYYRFASGGESQDEPAILWAIYHELTSPIRMHSEVLPLKKHFIQQIIIF